MVSISDAKASNARITKDTVPYVAVLTGGTDGIGKATLVRLVGTNQPIKIYVIGRNGDKHKPFLNDLRKSNQKADIVWLEGQVSLLAEVKRLCDTIKVRETSIDILFMSAGFITSGERIDTAEGNLLSTSLNYYARVLMTIHLLPLLNASSNSPRVLTILAGGNEFSDIVLDDLDFKKKGYPGLVPYSRSVATYTTLCMSRMAMENPSIVFIHHYPGGVNTGLFKKSFGNRWFWYLLAAVLAVAGISPEDAAEKAVFMLTSAKYGGKGVALKESMLPALNMSKSTKLGLPFLVREKLQEVQREEIMDQLNRVDAENIVWKHTMKIIGVNAP